MKKNYLKVRGFTIIETSLVLAIGGLILAMVFIALPSLQRSQRDTQRKADISNLIAEIKNYQTNNNGALPTNDTMVSVNEGAFKLTVGRVPISTPGDGDLNLDPGARPSVLIKNWTVTWPVSDNEPETSWGGFYRKYLGSKFMDPDGENYKLYIVACGTNSLSVDAECTTTVAGGQANVSEKPFPNDYKISIITGATCEDTRAIKVANPRMVAALYRLEGSGEYCAHT